MIKSVFDLSGQVAIVTGGGIGIGRAVAVELARAGADITICSRDPVHLEPTAAEIRALGRRCLAVPVDVRQPDQIENMVQRTLDEFGRIDILVNNAGAKFSVAAQKMSFNAWNTIIGINLTGTFLCCKAVFDTMANQKAGKIVNISSVAGREGDPTAVHYGASKAGMINLTRSLASDWGKYGIRVNCLAPGPVETEGGHWALKDDVYDTGLMRAGLPEEVGYAALFLASNASSYVTGATLFVDGGVKAKRIL